MLLSSPFDLSYHPTRIISVVPSQTELLYYLGLDSSVTGITKFCVHPRQWLKLKSHVGGTKSLNLEKIKELMPDLILANKEENLKPEIETLAELFPVWVTDIGNLEDALLMIKDVGIITSTEWKAIALCKEIKKNFVALEKKLSHPAIPAAFLIWQKPFITIGGDCFINDMMKRAGLSNVFAHLNRYPEISIEQINQSGAEVLILSSEPFPFSQKHIDMLQPLFPSLKIILADGEMFSWYGSRLLKAPDYFQQLVSGL